MDKSFMQHSKCFSREIMPNIRAFYKMFLKVAVPVAEATITICPI
jgi:hypothetical protein